MKLYSDFSRPRSVQVVGDVLAALVIGCAIWLGMAAHGLIAQLADFGRSMQDSGSAFASNMTEIGETLGGVPLIGGGIRAPFDAAGAAGTSLEDAGASQVDIVNRLATGTGLVLALLPIAAVLLVWILPRLRWARRAGAVATLVRRGLDVDLWSLRALSRQKMSKITRIDPDPVAAWRRADPEVLRQLAALELRSAGVRLR